MTGRIPPYYPNPDDTHCSQCCFRMALEYFDPNRPWSFAELVQLSGKEDGKPTWPMKMWSGLPALGYDIIVYDDFDYDAFSKDPLNTIALHCNGDENLISYVKQNDLNKTVAENTVFLDMVGAGNIVLKQESYTPQTVKSLLDSGCLIISWVDDGMLMDGFNNGVGHFILLYDYDDSGFWAQNPTTVDQNSGEQQHIPFDHFMNAVYVNREAKKTGDMTAIRKKMA